MKLAYQKGEIDWCRNPSAVMMRDKNDYFIAVCPKCADEMKKTRRKKKLVIPRSVRLKGAAHLQRSTSSQATDVPLVLSRSSLEH